jgi:hypothetical protein
MAGPTYRLNQNDFIVSVGNWLQERVLGYSIIQNRIQGLSISFVLSPPSSPVINLFLQIGQYL